MADSTETIGYALLLALVTHGLVIFGVGFEPLPEQSPDKQTEKLDIILVQQPRETKPQEKADFLAETSQEGGGTKEEPVRPRAPEPEPVIEPLPPMEPLVRPMAPPPTQQPSPSVVTTQTPAPSVEPRPRPPEPPEVIPPAPPRLDASKLFASTRNEIARLSAELSNRTQAYAKRPRRKFLNASTQEYKYASYLEAWRLKVERIGNLNYPDEAKRKKLYGNLILSVAVRANGSVERVRVVKSSGHKVLDDAAVRIVRLAAPFAPFPEEIRKETDILEITRTWKFSSNNQLFSR